MDKSEHHERGIDNETFEQCLGPLGLEKNLITERIFAFFDQDRDGVISFTELVGGLSVLCKGNLDEKIECKFVSIILMKIISLMFIIYIQHKNTKFNYYNNY